MTTDEVGWGMTGQGTWQGGDREGGMTGQGVIQEVDKSTVPTVQQVEEHLRWYGTAHLTAVLLWMDTRPSERAEWESKDGTGVSLYVKEHLELVDLLWGTSWVLTCGWDQRRSQWGWCLGESVLLISSGMWSQKHFSKQLSLEKWRLWRCPEGDSQYLWRGHKEDGAKLCTKLFVCSRTMSDCEHSLKWEVQSIYKKKIFPHEDNPAGEKAVQRCCVSILEVCKTTLDTALLQQPGLTS